MTRGIADGVRPGSTDFTSVLLWLVFLAIPAIIVGVNGDTLGDRLLAWAGLALFGLGYALCYLRPRLVPALPVSANLVLWTVLMCAPLALTAPLIGWNVVATAPFVASVFLFHLPLLPGLLVTGSLYLAIAGGVLTSNTLHPANFLGLIIGITVGAAFVVLMRVVGEWDQNRVETDTMMAVARERVQVARDVHDILGHSLTVIAVKTELARRLVRSDPDAAERELDEVGELARASLAQVRGTVTDLRAPDFATQLDGARSALRAAGVALHTEGDALEPPHGAVFVAALRELTTNAVRHADAANVHVRWERDRLVVSDDGRGMSGAAHGNGLTGLAERAAAAGASVTLGESSPGTGRPGTTVEVRLA